MRQRSDGARPRRLPHAHVQLPRLSTDEALLVAHLLERIERAIWRAHGDAMADRLAAPWRWRPSQSDLFTAVARREPDGQDCHPDAPDDVDF